jgi:hypothetical protein
MTDPKITSVGIAAALLLFSALLFGERAEAQYVNGNTLLEWCEGDRRTDDAACTGYIAGITDVTDTYERWALLTARDFCIPEHVNTPQLQKIVIKGLNEEPERLHMAAGGAVVNILFEAFPCG